MDKSKEIPEQHQLKCEGCGKMLDKRDISVLSHGWIEGDKIVCYLDEWETWSYSKSKKIGDSIEWTKDKKPIHLN